MRPEIYDEIVLSIPTGPETTENRWWSISQPPPSVAFSLQGSLASALGPGVYDGILDLLRIVAQREEGENPEEKKIEDFLGDQAAMGEAQALRIYRRARSGKSLCDHGEPLDTASERLRIALNFVARKSGVQLSSSLLLGESERIKANMGFGWKQPALLHRLLLASQLKFGGHAQKPRYPSGAPGDEAPGADLWSAVNEGSTSKFMQALDRVLISADELALLCTWATIHLFRPF